jgi:hypothetical protein
MADQFGAPWGGQDDVLVLKALEAKGAADLGHKSIVQAHDGSLAPGGLRVTVRLPAAPV